MNSREQELETRLEAAEKYVVKLLARIAVLEAQIAQLTRNSTNSSKPPSSNPPGNASHKINLASGKNRKRGGQIGHPGKKREFLQADAVEHLVPTTCSNCHNDFSASERDPSPSRHQQIEMPPVKAVVTDYFFHTLKCRCCGNEESPALPSQLQTGAFGPNICAFTGLLAGRYRLSKRLICELMHDVFGINMALGTVSNIEQRLSRALEKPVDAAASFVQNQDVVHADETGWTEDKNKAWMWVAACAQVAIFVIARSRGSDVAKRLLGPSFSGILVSDRWSGYAWIDVNHRQLCWSHLLRDFQSWIDDGNQGVEYGAALKTRMKRIFILWRSMQAGDISRATFQKKIKKHQIAVATYLDLASQCGDFRTMAMAKRILKLEPAIWAFTDSEHVEPTNNYAERLVRPAVIWRKVSFGTDSLKGSRFAERMLTTVMTLRLQSRSVLDFLRAALLAPFQGRDQPSLLPL